MAVNKITHSWNENYTGLIFTGSQRQPTLVEVRNYCVAQHIPLEGVYISAVRLGGEWTPPEDAKSLEIFEFGENCPVCGKAFVLDTDICPICHKRWDKELATVRLTAAVDAELTAAGSKNNIAVRAMLADFLKEAKVVDGKVTSKENGETITLGAKVEAMKKDAATDFMFGAAPKYNGWKPGENGDGGKPDGGKKLSEMSYSELTEYMAKNPDAKLE